MAVVATRSGLFWGPSGGIIERHLGIYQLLTQLFETSQQPVLDPLLTAWLETVPGPEVGPDTD